MIRRKFLDEFSTKFNIVSLLANKIFEFFQRLLLFFDSRIFDSRNQHERTPFHFQTLDSVPGGGVSISEMREARMKGRAKGSEKPRWEEEEEEEEKKKGGAGVGEGGREGGGERGS